MSIRRPSLATVVLTPTALAAGAALGLWLYKRWGYSVDSEETDVPTVDAPPEAEGPEIQHAEDGEGPRFHRTYRVRIAGAEHTPEALMKRIGQDLSPYVAAEVARFEKTKGAESVLEAGDEFMVHINAPWNGPVRVVEAEPTRFRLATLEGHMEAGQIEFRAETAPEASGETAPGDGADAGPNADSGADLVFTIESWARSRDMWVHLVYDGLGTAKSMQQAMWTYFCARVADECGGEIVGEIEVRTEREEA